jgi:hypothetical protein
MFGAVCSGRPVQIATEVEPTKYVIAIPNAANVLHIALFLLPQTQFTDANFTALVYIQLPGAAEFQLLGGLNPLKPSAIYKLNNNAGAAAVMAGIDDEMSIDAAGGAPATINVGISIEPTPQAEVTLLQQKQQQGALVRAPRSAPRPAPTEVATLANRIVTHAYNYLGSFIDASGRVPMKAFDTWWDKFRTKLQNNPDFLNEI